MEENKSTSKEYKLSRKKQKSPRYNQILAFVAYIGIGCIAIALLLTLIFKGDTKLAQVFSAIGQVVAYIICIVLAYSWVKTQKHIAWLICYVVFVVTIIVLFILTI